MVASLSARRAWIEIDFEGKLDADLWVALRKESVDRNKQHKVVKFVGWLSLSARRAWIEITSNREKRKYPEVALRKESVDRNSL